MSENEKIEKTNAKGSVIERIRAAYEILRGAAPIASGAFAREEDFGFRRITAKSQKELSEFDWRKQMDVCHFLWLTNPLAFRMVELLADFVIGDGYKIVAKEKRVQKVIDDHWFDPDNAWDLKMFERHVEMSTFGSFTMTTDINPQNGLVKLNPLDPMLISALKPFPNRPGQVNKMFVDSAIESGVPIEHTVAQIERSAEAENFGLWTGSAFYFGINKLSFTVQGISDLFRVADWLDAYDQFLFHGLERIRFLNAHLYDITINGAQDAEIKNKVQDLELNPPKPGGFRIHNEKEVWSALAPKINTAELDEMAKIVKMLILGSFGIPEHWFAEGGNVNKATAGEMSGPILKKISRRQSFWAEGILRTILAFQVDQAVIAGAIPGDMDKSFEIVAPTVSERNAKALADTLLSLVTALDAAVLAGYITSESASEVVASQASEFGIDVSGLSKPEQDIQKARNGALQDEKAAAIESDLYAAMEFKKENTELRPLVNEMQEATRFLKRIPKNDPIAKEKAEKRFQAAVHALREATKKRKPKLHRRLFK